MLANSYGNLEVL